METPNSPPPGAACVRTDASSVPGDSSEPCTNMGAVPLQSGLTMEMVSMRTPGLVAGMTLLSEPTRHFNWMFCPDAAAGRLTTLVM